MLAFRWTSCCPAQGGDARRPRSRLSARAGSGRLAAQPGFTLVETLVVIGALGVALTAGFMFYVGTFNRTQDAEARRNALADQRVAIERIARDVRQAGAVTAPALGGSGDLLALSGPAGSVAYDCTATSGSCIRTAGGDGQLLIEGLDPDSAPVFDTVAANHVRVRLQMLPDGRQAPIALEREVTLRNEGVGQ